MFPNGRWLCLMPEPPNLCPATSAELTQSLCFALRFNAPKRVHDADETMARITAERLVEHLERSGHVAMHKPPLGQHGAPGNLADWIEKASQSGRGEWLGVVIPRCIGMPADRPRPQRLIRHGTQQARRIAGHLAPATRANRLGPGSLLRDLMADVGEHFFGCSFFGEPLARRLPA
jgi:hypothetical protein